VQYEFEAFVLAKQISSCVLHSTHSLQLLCCTVKRRQLPITAEERERGSSTVLYCTALHFVQWQGVKYRESLNLASIYRPLTFLADDRLLISSGNGSRFVIHNKHIG
jgi:hypothetical protein